MSKASNSNSLGSSLQAPTTTTPNFSIYSGTYLFFDVSASGVLMQFGPGLGALFKVEHYDGSNSLQGQILLDDLGNFQVRSDSIIFISNTGTLNLAIGPSGNITLQGTAPSINIQTGGGNYRIGGNQVLAGRITGWGDPTNTMSRLTFDTTTVTLPQLASRVGQLILDCKTHGFITT